jgi:hypothetical protein
MGTLSFGGPHSAAAEAGFIFLRGFAARLNAVPFPVVVNRPVLVDVGGNATGAERDRVRTRCIAVILPTVIKNAIGPS